MLKRNEFATGQHINNSVFFILFFIFPFFYVEWKNNKIKYKGKVREISVLVRRSLVHTATLGARHQVSKPRLTLAIGCDQISGSLF